MLHVVVNVLAILVLYIGYQGYNSSRSSWEESSNYKVPSMSFWSVSWSTNCPVYFSLFLSTKKIFFSLREFLVRLWCSLVDPIFFGIPKFLFSIPKYQSLTKKNSETDQKFPETKQFFFGRPKKMRNRPDNWSTKRLTKTTWTGLWSTKRLTKSTWTSLILFYLKFQTLLPS